MFGLLHLVALELAWTKRGRYSQVTISDVKNRTGVPPMVSPPLPAQTGSTASQKSARDYTSEHGKQHPASWSETTTNNNYIDSEILTNWANLIFLNIFAYECGAHRMGRGRHEVVSP